MTTVQKNAKPVQTEDFIRVQDLFYLCLSKWRWFLISLFATLGIAMLYIVRTPPVYTRTASILIKDDSKGKSMSTDIESFSNFGLFQSNTNVNNELIALQSPAIILEVAKRLHLDMDYLTDGRFHKRVVYGSELLATVLMEDITENESASFTMQFLADGSLSMSDFKRNDEDVPQSQEVKGRFLEAIPSPLGKITVMPTSHYEEGTVTSVYVNRSPLYGAVSRYTSNLRVSLSDEKSSIINLSFNDVSKQRAEDVLNMLITVYNENWVRDKNQIAVSTSMFINDRLMLIEAELGNVDEDISSYKSKHLLPDVQAASSMYMEQSSEANAQIMTLNNQLYMARYVRNYLTGEVNKDQLLPANSGIANSNIESLISEYNTKQLQRNNLVANSSTQNPLVIDLDHSLVALRKVIITSIDNQLVTLNEQIKNLQQSEQQTTVRIAANPSQAKYLLSVERQQKVKEALYLFLLQKREENELSQAFTAYNTRVVTPPTGKMTPTAPVKKNILLVAFILGLLVPVVILFIREKINTTIRGRKDLEDVTLPFIGEIPLFFRRKRGWQFWQKQHEVSAIVVKEGNRNIINEAFRVLRTNLEFMVGKKDKSNVIILTSFNSGSGKTFLTMNTAISLAIKGKKVLIIDGDLRHASLSSYVNSPKNGLSNYLGRQIDNPNDIIVVDEKYINLSILPVGTIPPNPTELLFEERLGELITNMRSKYDYIFIDCPPIDIVADTQIIEKLSDRTFFVVRAGLLERSMLSDLENIYKEERFKNMALILNGTTNSSGRYRYGYRYGYQYGYYDSIKKKGVKISMVIK